MSNYNTMSDDDLLNIFSDWYKEVNGFRPRGEYWTRERIINWIEYESDPEVQEMRQCQWAEESRRLDEMLNEMEASWKEEQLRLEAEQEELYQDSIERMFYEMEEQLC